MRDYYVVFDCCFSYLTLNVGVMLFVLLYCIACFGINNAECAQDGRERRCQAPFSLLGPHVCSPPAEANGFANMQSVAQAEAIIAQAGAVSGAPSEAAPVAVAASLSTAVAASSSAVEGVAAEQSPADVADVPMQELSQPLVPQSALFLAFCGLCLTQAADARVCTVPAGMSFCKGHTRDVILCSWHPLSPVLATGYVSG